VAVFVDDGLGAKTMTLPIVDRAFYQRFGYLLFPEYCHLFCDNDLEEVSRRRGKLIDAKHLEFPHRHSNVEARPWDETYRKANGPWARDAHVFAKRQVRDFDLRPGTLRDHVICGWLDVRYYLRRPLTLAKTARRRLRAKSRSARSSSNRITPVAGETP
jgi:hypothetical protein